MKSTEYSPTDEKKLAHEKRESEQETIDDVIEKEISNAEKENPRTTTLFIVPPFPARTFPGRTMGPDYIGSHLRETQKQGIHNIDNWEILDLDIIPQDKREEILRQKLRETPFAFIGISYLSFQANEAMEMAELCAKELKDVGDRETTGESAKNYTPIVCGGRGVTDAEDYAHLYPNIDFWVTGKNFHQPLDSVVHIAELVKNQKTLDMEARRTIPGIVSYNPGENEIIKTAPNIEPEYPIDSYFENIERKEYHPSYDFDIFKDEANDRFRKTAQVYTQLGCNRYCRFCFESLRPQPTEERSIKSFIKEAISLVRQGYEGIYFDDSTFTQNKPRALRMMQTMGKLHRRFGIVWGFNTRIDCLDEELIDTAVKNGCVYNFEGVESLNPAVIEGMGKLSGKTNPYFPPLESGEEYVQKTKEVYKIMKDEGLTTAVFLIFGGPKKTEGDNIESATIDDDKLSIKESIWELQPKYLSFNIMRFIPDAAISRIPQYKNYRGGQEFKGGFYYNKYRKQYYGETSTTEHPIYQAFESAGERYPIPPRMTPEVCYELLQYMVDQVNDFYKKTGQKIILRTDENFAEQYLTRGNDGIYKLVDFEKIK